MTPIVFLHIPKTAGQTIHDALVRLAGDEAKVSPVRVHSQRPSGPQMPPGYSVYSGHLDWTELDSLPEERFVFTVLRDPRERIASFYFYLLNEAQGLSPEELAKPENRGMQMVRSRSADDYFLGGDAAWQSFIRDHYENFYVSYLATRRIRGRSALDGLGSDEQIRRAVSGAARLDRIYDIDGLHKLEGDLRGRYHQRVSIVNRKRNAGVHAAGVRRWPALMGRMERDGTARRMEDFVSLDEALMSRLSDEGLFRPAGRTEKIARGSGWLSLTRR